MQGGEKTADVVMVESRTVVDFFFAMTMEL